MRGHTQLTLILAATVLVITSVMLLVRKEIRGAASGKFDVLFSSTSFVGVPFFLQRQFTSCIGAALSRLASLKSMRCARRSDEIGRVAYPLLTRTRKQRNAVS